MVSDSDTAERRVKMPVEAWRLKMKRLVPCRDFVKEVMAGDSQARWLGYLKGCRA